jgi:hypothetical protein
MAATHGRLDSQGCPLAVVAIFPEGQPGSAKDFEALIDTGFTGFAQMPKTAAALLGMQPTATMDVTFFGGVTHPVPVTWGSARLGADTREGFIILSDSDETLVGIHFLRLFRKTLIHSAVEEEVILTDRTPNQLGY